jgi:4-amino-4-deoxy-L-arabinose transferase-like glycosyltransferase
VVAGGASTVATRWAAAGFGLLTGAVLFVFARRLYGIAAGAVAFLIWALLPDQAMIDGVHTSGAKLERFALLDVVMGTFMALVLYLGWRSTRERELRWPIAAGAAAGLATAAKAPGAFALVPLVAAAALAVRGPRRAARRTAAVLGSWAGAITVTYLPVIGRAPGIVHDMFEYHAEQGRLPHPALIDGHLYVRPPSWASFWFLWRSVGATATVGLLALVAVAAVVVERRLVAYIGLAVVPSALYLALATPNALPHYYYVLLPPLVLLAALGLYRAATGGCRARVVAAGCAVPLLIGACSTLARVGGLRDRDYAALPAILRQRGLERGPILVNGLGDVLQYYMPEAVVTHAPRGAPLAIVVDPAITRRAGDPFGAIRYLAAHRSNYDHTKVDQLDVYLSGRAP